MSKNTDKYQSRVQNYSTWYITNHASSAYANINITPCLRILGMECRLLPLCFELVRVQGRHLEVRALPRLDPVDVHPVKLLQRPAPALNDEEVDDKGRDKHAAREHITVGKVDGTRDERREETDQEVPQPVRGNGQSHTLGTVLGGVQLRSDGPDHRSPGHRVTGNVDTREEDHTLTRGGGQLGVLHIEDEVTDRSKDHEAEEQPQCTHNQGLATTKVLNGVQTTKGRDKVDRTQDDLGNEAVGQTSTLEDGGTLGPVSLASKRKIQARGHT